MNQFEKAIMDGLLNPFEKILQQQSVQELVLRTSDIIITVTKQEQDKSHIEMYCDLFAEPLKLVVNKSILDLKTIKLTDKKLQTLEQRTLFFEVLNYNKITVCWDVAKEALTCGHEVTRLQWQEQGVLMTIYNHVKNEDQKYQDLRIYFKDRKDCSTGWSPSVDDKAAKDWVIKKRNYE